MPIQALIFDCDGTLADSMPMHWRAWKQVTDEYQLRFPKDRFYAMGGVPAPDILKILAEEQGRELDYLKAAKEKEAAFARQIPEIQEIEMIVGIAREHYGKIPMAVASGGTRRVVTETLRHLGIASLFQTVVTTEDVARQKPAPDIYLEAARRLGVEPQNCRAYEDTDLGLQAIRAAGMEAIDVRPLLASTQGAQAR
ncbi:MAG: HAD family phosphatase [Verrucomicrobiota bacterium]|jgi:beta-phosphoglucomutase-like phosphatase (HAD superfamily)